MMTPRPWWRRFGRRGDLNVVSGELSVEYVPASPNELLFSMNLLDPSGVQQYTVPLPRDRVEVLVEVLADWLER